MNRLKFIRTQCNLSLNNVAQTLNVSRQIVSAWENGKKDIPKERKEQLVNYFGIYAPMKQRSEKSCFLMN